MRKYLVPAIIAACALPQAAHAEQGDVLLRARAILVAPTESSGSILPSFPGEEVGVGDSFMPEVDITYMVTDHLGLELIAATTRHEISGQTGTTGAIGELGSTWVLPPTLTLQYHFAPEGGVHPYVGAGINYSIFHSEDASNGLENAIGSTRISLDDSFGFALQAGMDVDVGERVFLNFDIKYIYMDTTATITNATIGTQQVDVDINPIVVGFGIGIRL